MSGGTPSKTPSQRAREFADAVEDYSRARGLLPPAPLPARVRGHMALSGEELAALDGRGLAAVNLDVASFAHLLQEEVNLQRAKAEHCKNAVSRLVDGRLDDYSAFKTEDKRTQAALDDPAALGYLDVQRNCECFVRRWEGMVERLDAFARAVERMSYNTGKSHA